MADEPTPSTQGTEAPAQSEAPTDFREYAAWRATGELPQKEEPPATPAAADATEQPPAKTAPDSEPETEEDQEQDTPADAKPGSRRSRKIERLTREVEELKRALSGHAPDAKPTQPPEPAKAEGKPKLEDFQTLEEFQEALTDWKLDQREKTRAEADAKRAHDEAAKAAFEEWAKREKAAKKAHDDYEDVLDSVTIPDGPGVQAARQAMLESEHGAEVLYHLAKHPAELKRIAALSPVSAVREVGKLEAAIAKPSAPENGTARITGAPKPPPPTGRPSKTTTDDLTDPEVIRDYSKWEKLRMAQLRSR